MPRASDALEKGLDPARNLARFGRIRVLCKKPETLGGRFSGQRSRRGAKTFQIFQKRFRSEE